MTTWWWIPHAPVTCHGGRIYGNNDLPCDTSEQETFRTLAQLLPRDAVWVTSHLQRTHQTADAILREMDGHAPRHRLAEPDLGEQAFGDWQGLTHDELAARRDGAWHRFWLAPAHERPPGGESFDELVARVGASIERINSAHPDRNIVAVAHGGTIRAALAIALGIAPEGALAFQVANCALTRLQHIPGPLGSHSDRDEGAWAVVAVNLDPKAMVSAKEFLS